MKPSLLHPVLGPGSDNGNQELYSVKWNNYPETVLRMFRKYLRTEVLSDITLCCDGGKSIGCHRIILAACSTYFEEMLAKPNVAQRQPAVFFFRDMEFWELEALVAFMYFGEVRVEREKLTQLVKAAGALKIKGLAPETQFDMEEDLDSDLEAFPYSPEIAPSTSTSKIPTPPRPKLIATKRKLPMPSAPARKISKPGVNGGTSGGTSKPPLLHVSKEKLAARCGGLTEEEQELLCKYEREAMKSWTNEERAAAGLPPQEEEDSELGTEAETSGDGPNDGEQELESGSGEKEQEPEDNDEEIEEVNLSSEGEGEDNDQDDEGEEDEQEGSASPSGSGMANQEPKRRSAYDRAFREQALAALQSGLTLRQCSETFKIPRKTLSKWKQREGGVAVPDELTAKSTGSTQSPDNQDSDEEESSEGSEEDPVSKGTGEADEHVAAEPAESNDGSDSDPSENAADAPDDSDSYESAPDPSNDSDWKPSARSRATRLAESSDESSSEHSLVPTKKTRKTYVESYKSAEKSDSEHSQRSSKSSDHSESEAVCPSSKSLGDSKSRPHRKSKPAKSEATTSEESDWEPSSSVESSDSNSEDDKQVRSTGIVLPSKSRHPQNEASIGTTTRRCYLEIIHGKIYEASRETDYVRPDLKPCTVNKGKSGTPDEEKLPPIIIGKPDEPRSVETPVVKKRKSKNKNKVKVPEKLAAISIEKRDEPKSVETPVVKKRESQPNEKKEKIQGKLAAISIKKRDEPKSVENSEMKKRDSKPNENKERVREKLAAVGIEKRYEPKSVETPAVKKRESKPNENKAKVPEKLAAISIEKRDEPKRVETPVVKERESKPNEKKAKVPEKLAAVNIEKRDEPKRDGNSETKKRESKPNENKEKIQGKLAAVNIEKRDEPKIVETPVVKRREHKPNENKAKLQEKLTAISIEKRDEPKIVETPVVKKRESTSNENKEKVRVKIASASLGSDVVSPVIGPDVVPKTNGLKAHSPEPIAMNHEKKATVSIIEYSEFVNENQAVEIGSADTQPSLVKPPEIIASAADVPPPPLAVPTKPQDNEPPVLAAAAKTLHSAQAESSSSPHSLPPALVCENRNWITSTPRPVKKSRITLDISKKPMEVHIPTKPNSASGREAVPVGQPRTSQDNYNAYVIPPPELKEIGKSKLKQEISKKPMEVHIPTKPSSASSREAVPLGQPRTSQDNYNAYVIPPPELKKIGTPKLSLGSGSSSLSSSSVEKNRKEPARKPDPTKLKEMAGASPVGGKSYTSASSPYIRDIPKCALREYIQSGLIEPLPPPNFSERPQEKGKKRKSSNPQ